ncbi:MAG: sugar phosphate nucleotidyltransferase [Desulfobacteraceae bacterium]|jgi:NDP-sugar pyrophosphorylase family protein
MVIVIPAGGIGSRVAHLHAADIPKSMMDFAGKPFLEHQLLLFSKSGFNEIIISVHYLANKIIDYFGDGNKWGINISYVDDGKEPLGFGGSIKKAARAISDDYFAIVDGDTFLPIDFKLAEQHFIKSQANGMITVTDNYPKYYKGNIVIQNNKVLSIREKYSLTMEKMPYIDCGFRILNTKDIIKYPKRIFHLQEYLNTLIDRQELIAYNSPNRFYEVGCPEGVKDFQNYIKNYYVNRK